MGKRRQLDLLTYGATPPRPEPFPGAASTRHRPGERASRSSSYQACADVFGRRLPGPLALAATATLAALMVTSLVTNPARYRLTCANTGTGRGALAICASDATR